MRGRGLCLVPGAEVPEPEAAWVEVQGEHLVLLRGALVSGLHKEGLGHLFLYHLSLDLRQDGGRGHHCRDGGRGAVQSSSVVIDQQPFWQTFPHYMCF